MDAGRQGRLIDPTNTTRRDPRRTTKTGEENDDDNEEEEGNGTERERERDSIVNFF
jgi:hypothetical protein